MLPHVQATAASAEATASHRRREPEAARPRAAATEAAPNAGAVGTRATLASANPRQREPTRACGRRSVTSRDHEAFQLRHVRRPDPGHPLQLVDRVEGAVLLPVVEDLLRGQGADAGQILELLERQIG